MPLPYEIARPFFLDWLLSDEHDPDCESKPFPEKEYLHELVRFWLANRLNLYEKSRQMRVGDGSSASPRSARRRLSPGAPASLALTSSDGFSSCGNVVSGRTAGGLPSQLLGRPSHWKLVVWAPLKSGWGRNRMSVLLRFRRKRRDDLNT